VRTPTLSICRSDRRAALEGLRNELSPPDRMLLILRVDRDLPWREVARVMSEAAVDDERLLSHVAARLRKRFQLIRERLWQRARQRGLI
jgi:RNA polymerase sigma-70 factor (ECF subfamily)